MKTNAKKPMIFIIEDDLFYAEILKSQLIQKEHSNICVFNNGKQALKNLYKQPKVILLDYNLGDHNGLDVLKRIKAYDPNIQVILLSGQDDVKVAVNCLKYGAYDYVSKNEKTSDRIHFLIRKIMELNAFIQREETMIKKRKWALAAIAVVALFLIQLVVNH